MYLLQLSLFRIVKALFLLQTKRITHSLALPFCLWYHLNIILPCYIAHVEHKLNQYSIWQICEFVFHIFTSSARILAQSLPLARSVVLSLSPFLSLFLFLFLYLHKIQCIVFVLLIFFDGFRLQSLCHTVHKFQEIFIFRFSEMRCTWRIYAVALGILMKRCIDICVEEKKWSKLIYDAMFFVCVPQGHFIYIDENNTKCLLWTWTKKRTEGKIFFPFISRFGIRVKMSLYVVYKRRYVVSFANKIPKILCIQSVQIAFNGSWWLFSFKSFRYVFLSLFHISIRIVTLLLLFNSAERNFVRCIHMYFRCKTVPNPLAQTR